MRGRIIVPTTCAPTSINTNGWPLIRARIIAWSNSSAMRKTSSEYSPGIFSFTVLPSVPGEKQASANRRARRCGLLRAARKLPSLRSLSAGLHLPASATLAIRLRACATRSNFFGAGGRKSRNARRPCGRGSHRRAQESKRSDGKRRIRRESRYCRDASRIARSTSRN